MPCITKYPCGDSARRWVVNLWLRGSWSFHAVIPRPHLIAAKKGLAQPYAECVTRPSSPFPSPTSGHHADPRSDPIFQFTISRTPTLRRALTTRRSVYPIPPNKHGRPLGRLGQLGAPQLPANHRHHQRQQHHHRARLAPLPLAVHPLPDNLLLRVPPLPPHPAPPRRTAHPPAGRQRRPARAARRRHRGCRHSRGSRRDAAGSAVQGAEWWWRQCPAAAHDHAAGAAGVRGETDAAAPGGAGCLAEVG